MHDFAGSPNQTLASIEVAHNDIIMSFTVSDEVIYVFIDIRHSPLPDRRGWKSVDKLVWCLDGIYHLFW